jgi:hypothetical protein
MKFFKAFVNAFRFDRTNWQAVALCCLAATVFWFFNALNKEHTATLSYPLQFKFDEARFIPVTHLPEQVQLNLTGSGWDLFRKSLRFRVEPLVIALEKPSETKKIPPATILPMAAVLLGDTRVNHVANDTLHLHIEPRQMRSVAVALNPKRLRFELGFGLSSGIEINPNAVQVEGPVSVLAKMPDTLWLPFNPGRLSKQVKTDVEIDPAGNKSLRLNPATVTVRFDVDELKDVTRTVRVVVLPANPYRFQMLTDSVRLVLRIPASQTAKLQNNLALLAVIDLQKIEPGKTKTLPDIKGLPPFAEVLMVDSVTIRKY